MKLKVPVLVVLLVATVLVLSSCGLLTALFSEGEDVRKPTVLQGMQFERITNTRNAGEAFPRLIDNDNIIYTSVDSNGHTKIEKMNLKNLSITTVRDNASDAFPIPGEDKYIFELSRNDGVYLCEGSFSSHAYSFLLMTGFSTETTMQPSVSPDSSKVAFHFGSSGVMAQIGVMERGNPFYSVICEGTSPTWSKDGKYIYADRKLSNGNYEIIRIDTTTGIVSTILSNSEKNYAFPQISPDGLWLSVEYDRNSIAVCDLMGDKFTVVIEGLRSIWSSHWGTDGFIYFASGEPYRDDRDIYRIKPILPY